MKKLLTTLFSITILTTAYSQSPFIYRDIPTVATPPNMSNNIQFIDIDNDGDKDLINNAGGRLSIYQSNGTEIDSLNPIQLQISGFLAFVDWDLDGLVDVITASGSRISIHKNLGNFEFATPVIVFNGTCYDFDVSDINSDGYFDLVSIHNGQITIFENQSGSLAVNTHSFSYPLTQLGGAGTRTILFDDIDSDGMKEMVFKSTWNKIYIYSQTGTYDFTLKDSIISNNIGKTDNAQSIFLYDLNNDGRNEIITRDGGKFSIFKWVSGYSYTTVYNANAAYTVDGGATIANLIPLSDFYDVDNNGFLDIVAGNYVYFNNGNFIFNRVNINNQAVFYDPGYKCTDLDNNGKTDICYVYTGNNLITNTSEYEAFFRSENVTAQIIEPKKLIWHLWGNPSNTASSIVDFDNDGDLDIFSYNRGKTILWENINGILYPKQLGLGLNYYNTSRIDFVDINQDGYEDLLIHTGNDLGADSHRYRLNQNGESLEDPLYYIANSEMSLKLIDDIDDDGIDELFYQLRNGSSHTIYMYKLETGTPVLATSFSWSQASTTGGTIRIGDYNLDGLKDIIIQMGGTSGINPRLFIAKNNGGNNFSIVQNISSGNAASLIGIIDADGDGMPDIICHNGNNRICSFKNNQGTISTTASIIGTVSQNLSGSIGMQLDFNGDGLDDIVIQSLYEQFLYRNNGAGFTRISYIPNSKQLIKVKDIDNDGDKDIICTNTWYENTSNALFEMEGIVFFDVNENGVFDSSTDIKFPYFPVQLNSGWETFYTDENGYFTTSLGSVEGNYSFTIDPSISSQFDATTLPYPSIISVDSLNPQGSLELGVSNLTNSINGKLDITLSGNRCNESGRIFINYQNYSPETVDAKIKLVLAENSSFSSSNQIPIHTTDTIVWQLNNLTPFEHGHFYADIQMPPTSSMGDTMNFQAQLILNGTLGSDTIRDNIQQILMCAYDPNDKNITMSESVYFGDSTFVFSDDIEYTIRFQNTGNDTAHDITILDNLSNLFDWNSIRPISASHSYQFSINSTGKISIIFNDIYLPDSTTDFLGSMGYIKFKLKYRENAPYYVPVNNYARIYFDENPPIITNVFTFYRVECNDFMNVNINTSLCERVQVSNTNSGFFQFNYAWTIDSQTASTPVATFLGLNSGQQILHLKLSNHVCKLDSSFNITIHPKPLIELNIGDTSICINDTLTISANYAVNWYFYQHYITTSPELIAPMSSPGEIWAIYTENGCSDTIMVNVNVKSINQMHNYAPIYDWHSSAVYEVCPNKVMELESNYGPIIWNVVYTNNANLNFTDTSQTASIQMNNSPVVLKAVLEHDGCSYTRITNFNLIGALDEQSLSVRIINGSNNFVDGPLNLNDTTYICTNKNFILRAPIKTHWYYNDSAVSYSTSFSPSQSGNYSVGCEKIPFTIILNQNKEILNTIYLCSGENYTYLDGTIVTNIQSNQTHTFTTQGNLGCSIITTTNLIVEQPTHQETVILCMGSSYTYPDGTISNNILSNESHVSNLSSINGCDSIVTTHIQIANEVTGILNGNSVELSVNNNAIIQWLDCNNNYEPIIGATGNVFTPTENGSYAAQIQLSGCTDTTECFILNTLTVNSLPETDMISYYPNPVKENLYINLHQAEENSEVLVRDVNGRLIAHEKFSNLKKLAIPFSHLSNGIYIVTVKTSEYEKQIHVRKEL